VRQRQKPTRIIEGGTLRLTWPVGQTLGLAVLLLILLAGICEGLARTTFARSRLLAPGVGGDHARLGAKLAALDRLVEEEGGVDCIFLGSSMAEWGIDPEVFSAAYKAQTGEHIRCFNFALLGMTASEVGIWADLLARDYHPRLLIYPTSARDYSERVAVPVVVTPWVDYRLGVFSLEGWLVDHSVAYRYYLTYNIWTLPNYPDLAARRAEFESGMSRYGFYPEPGTIDVSIPPDPEDFPLIRRSLADYRVSPEDLEGLKRMAGLRERGTPVLLVEAPLPATYMTFFDGGEQDYARFVEAVGGHAEAAGVPFWQTLSLDLIPGDGWADYGHLNQKGAGAFSEWLGTRVGEAVQAGTLPDPAH
jgi:hypothetical protein